MPLLIALLMGIYQAANIALSDLEFSRVNTELSFWGRQGYKPSNSRVSSVGASISNALQRSPENPQYLHAHGRYLLWRSYWESDAEKAKGFGEQAVDSWLQAMKQRPAHRQSWAELIGIKARLGQTDDLWQQAVEKTKTLQAEQE